MIFIGFGPKKAYLKNPIDFLFTFQPITKQTADVKDNVDGIEWLAIDALKGCFVNKQLTYDVQVSLG